MTSIIGNQEQRKSRINTEKWKEHREHYNYIRKSIREIETRTLPIEHENLEQKLLFDLFVPVLFLKPLTQTQIYVPTQKKYDTLMQVLEAGGWKWTIQAIRSASEQPTQRNNWTKYYENTLISVQGSIGGNNREFTCTSMNKDNAGQDIISINEFYRQQKITPDMITKLHRWYNKYHPERASKGK